MIEEAPIEEEEDILARLRSASDTISNPLASSLMDIGRTEDFLPPPERGLAESGAAGPFSNGHRGRKQHQAIRFLAPIPHEPAYGQRQVRQEFQIIHGDQTAFSFPEKMGVFSQSEPHRLLESATVRTTAGWKHANHAPAPT